MDCQTGLVAAKSKLLTLLKKIEARERERERKRERDWQQTQPVRREEFLRDQKKKLFLGWFGGVGWPPPEGCSCFSLYFLSLVVF